MKKFLKILLGLFGVAAVGIGAFLYFFDFNKLINEQKDKYLPEVEKVLGRKVAIGEIKTTVLPVLGAEIKDVAIQGRTPTEEPLLVIGSIDLKVDLWRAITSFGKDVQLSALVIRGLGVNLVREADGTLSYADVVKRLSEGPPPEETPPKPLDPEAKKFIQNLQLKRIAIEEGRFRLVDKATGGKPAETFVNHFLVELNDVILASAFEVHIAAGVFSDKVNFDFKTRVGPIAIGVPDAPPPPVAYVKIKADAIALAGISPYLPATAPVSLAQTTFGMDLDIQDPMAKSGHIKVAGSVDIGKLSVGMKTKGALFDFKATPNVDFTPATGSLDLTGFAISIDDMKLTAGGKVEGINAVPSFKDLTIKTEKFDLTKLFAAFPDAAAGLPPGSSLGGPFSIDVTASGTVEAQQVKASINFDGAGIVVGQNLNKPAGTPLNIQVDAGIAPDALDLRAFRFQVGDLALKLDGTVKNFKNPAIAIKGGTGKFDINGPVRLLPTVQKSIPPGVKVAGQAEIDIDVKGGQDNIDAKLLLGIYGADLAVPGTTVRGSGKIDVTAKGNPKENITVNVNMALAELNLVTPALVKPAGTPFDVKVDVAKNGNVVNLGQLLVNFGPLKLQGSGSANLGTKALDIKVELGRFSIADLSNMVQALKTTPIAKASLGMKLAFSGDPNQMSTIKADMQDFYFGLGRSSVAGTLNVENLEAPKIRFNFNAPILDLDEMFPPGPPEKEEPEKAGGAVPEIVKKIDLDGNLSVGQGKAAKFPFKNFVAKILMQGGIVRFEKMDFDAYEGHFTAAQTSANIGAAKPSFDVRAAIKNLSLMPLLTEQAHKPGTMSGRFSGDIALKGQGKVWAEISKNLEGTIGASVVDGKFYKADLNKEIVGPLAKKVPFLKLPQGPGGIAIKTLQGRFDIKDGKANLREPMKAETPEGPLVLDGWIGLDSTMKLTGKLMLAPGVIAAASGNKIKPPKPMPVGLTMGGTVDNPAITGIDVKELAEFVLTEAAKQMGAAALLDQAKKAEEMARGKVDEVKKKAEEVKKKAEDAAKKKAKDAAKKKAKDAVHGLF